MEIIQHIISQRITIDFYMKNPIKLAIFKQTHIFKEYSLNKTHLKS